MTEEIIIEMKLEGDKFVMSGIKNLREEIKKLNDQTEKNTKSETKSEQTKDKAEKTTKKLTNSNRQLVSSYLSLMFAGMAVDKMFSGQMGRMREMTGQTDIMDAFWTKILIKPQAEMTNLKAKFVEIESALNTAMGGKLDPALGWSAMIADWIAKAIEFGAQIALLKIAVGGLSGVTAASTGATVAGGAAAGATGAGAVGLLGSAALAGAGAAIAAKVIVDKVVVPTTVAASSAGTSAIGNTMNNSFSNLMSQVSAVNNTHSGTTARDIYLSYNTSNSLNQQCVSQSPW